MNTSDLIAELQALTEHEEELCFYFFPTYVSREAGPWGPEEVRQAHWAAWAVNPSLYGLLGEVKAEYRAEGETLDEALTKLIALVKAARG